MATTHDIVSRIVHPEAADLPPEMARKILTWKFTDADRERLGDLLDKNNAGTISQDEAKELETFTVLSDLLNILHAQAHLSLKRSASPEQAA